MGGDIYYKYFPLFTCVFKKPFNVFVPDFFNHLFYFFDHGLPPVFLFY
jgi:hypothetical protein